MPTSCQRLQLHGCQAYSLDGLGSGTFPKIYYLLSFWVIDIRHPCLFLLLLALCQLSCLFCNLSNLFPSDWIVPNPKFNQIWPISNYKFFSCKVSVWNLLRYNKTKSSVTFDAQKCRMQICLVIKSNHLSDHFLFSWSLKKKIKENRKNKCDGNIGYMTVRIKGKRLSVSCEGARNFLPQKNKRNYDQYIHHFRYDCNTDLYCGYKALKKLCIYVFIQAVLSAFPLEVRTRVTTKE